MASFSVAEPGGPSGGRLEAMLGRIRHSETKTMDLRPGKNEAYDRLITLPISEPLTSSCPRCRRGEPMSLVCRTLHHRKGSTLCSSFNIILRQGGIVVPRTSRSDGTGRRSVTQKSFYGFRHTLNLWLEVAGVTREKRKDMLGSIDGQGPGILSP